MIELTKVKRASEPIYLGDIPIEVFYLPDGQYVLNKSDTASQYISHFLTGKSPQALLYKDLTFYKYPVESERTSINAVPIEVATAFWRYWDKTD
jgi:hypothetical protein